MVNDDVDRRMLVKKASIINQVVVAWSVRELVMRHAHTHHRGVSATIKDIKRKCYWLNCALDVAQMIRQCSIYLEKRRVDLHNGEAFHRGTVQVW